ncbi:hypothetical protein GTGU_04103 [Trabulsiella guamensis ATCC 49490]|uniref:Uncharacterized protein n=1 Tax=Trabulsiella guamensis ATCC 49490 TaxID=1005994 RepID=A0A084ZQC0_9ENTR|nr:hypothetical protein [Trabulsiella guamensis]KFB99664.1 hypothetical protein GTGU_04103 [Trabulsiella guamensis ATCC 49490]
MKKAISDEHLDILITKMDYSAIPALTDGHIEQAVFTIALASVLKELRDYRKAAGQSQNQAGQQPDLREQVNTWQRRALEAENALQCRKNIIDILIAGPHGDVFIDGRIHLPAASAADVHAAVRKVIVISRDLHDFDGDKRGIYEALERAEDNLVSVLRKIQPSASAHTDNTAGGAA